jgi:hypothetical protein
MTVPLRTVSSPSPLRSTVLGVPAHRLDEGKETADLHAARWTGAAGLALVVILVAAIVAESTGPDSSASQSQVTATFVSARDTILLSGALFLIAMVAGLVFVIGLSTLASRHGREPFRARIASASGLLVIALMTLYGASFAAIGASIHDLHGHQALVYAVFRLISATDDGSGVFIALFVASVAYPLVRGGLAPRWLAILGLIAAAVRAIGALDITTLGALPFGPFMVGGTGFCLVWLGLTSIVLLLRARGREHTAPGLSDPLG